MFKKFISLLIFSFAFVSSLLSYQYQLSVGMIFRNEASYLKEWIEYHRLVGVEHFYLFNDRSKDRYKKVLAPYIARGIVELYDAVTQSDFNGTQVDCFNRTLIKSRGVSKWVAMIDSDEFLVTPEGIQIMDVLNQYQKFGGVIVNWRSFGTSYVTQVPSDKLMIECLTHCAPPMHPMNHMVKSIVRPERVNYFGGPHWPEYVSGWFSVDSDGIPYTPPNPLSKMNKLWINHYWTRDEDFLINVKIPRGLPWGRSEQSVLETAKQLNAMTDDCILRHVPALRKKVFKRKQ